MRTVPDFAGKAEQFHNDHVFQWLSEAFADPAVSVRSDFPLKVADDGSYTVTITASPKVKTD